MLIMTLIMAYMPNMAFAGEWIKKADSQRQGDI
jgi:hypothetical protein